MPFNIGETVGPYRILEQLGQGGMATVYKAYHAALDRYVAIKALHPAFLEEPNFLARFEREARLVAKLEHPNIVPIYDAAEDSGRPYLVMKFIEGETLKARLSRGFLGYAEIDQILRQVGAALSYAHSQGILHRDVKPSNVLITADNHIYLTDFGLARIAQAGDSTLSSDMILGTPQYISPEQALGLKDLDERTDVYSLGVMIYEMVVGRVPFNADTPFAVIHDHIYSSLPLPRQINPDVPEGIERVLLKGLAKERQDRFQNIAEMVNAFHAAIPVIPETPATTALKTEQETYILPPSIPTVAEQNKVEPAPVPPAETVAAGALPATIKKKSKTGLIIGVVAGVLVTICLCLVVLNGINKNNARKLANAPTPTSNETVAQTPTKPTSSASGTSTISAVSTEDLQRADEALNNAVIAWKAVETIRFITDMAEVATIIDGNALYYEQSGDQLVAKDAWLPAAIMYLYMQRAHPEGLSVDQINKIHEAVYQASKDPQIKSFYDRPLVTAMVKDREIFTISRARYLLYNENPTQAQDLLANIQDNPDVIKLDPEVKLVEGEIYWKQGNLQQAMNTWKPLTTNSQLPLWIIAQSKSLIDLASK